jgi:hypothetical protein
MEETTVQETVGICFRSVSNNDLEAQQAGNQLFFLLLFAQGEDVELPHIDGQFLCGTVCLDPAAPPVDFARQRITRVRDVVPAAGVKWARKVEVVVRLPHGAQVDEGEGGFQRPDLLGQGRLCQEGGVLQKASELMACTILDLIVQLLFLEKILQIRAGLSARPRGRS